LESNEDYQNPEGLHKNSLATVIRISYSELKNILKKPASEVLDFSRALIKLLKKTHCSKRKIKWKTK